MRFQIPHLARRPKPISPAEVVDLSSWNGRGDDVLTPIHRPDSLGPIPHRLPALDPDQADCRLLVTQIVSDLHARGGLDAGHAAVLDHWIDSQLAGWLTVVDQQTDARRRTTEQLLAVDRENLTREALELSQPRHEQITLETEHRYWRDLLSGHHDGPPPRAAAPEQATAAPPMPALPDYRPVTYLAGQPPATAPEVPAARPQSQDPGKQDAA